MALDVVLCPVCNAEGTIPMNSNQIEHADPVEYCNLAERPGTSNRYYLNPAFTAELRKYGLVGLLRQLIVMVERESHPLSDQFLSTLTLVLLRYKDLGITPKPRPGGKPSPL